MIEYRPTRAQAALIQVGEHVRFTKRNGVGRGNIVQGEVTRVAPYEIEGQNFVRIYSRWGRDDGNVTWVSNRYWDYTHKGHEVIDDPRPRAEPINKKPEPKPVEAGKKPFKDDSYKEAFI